MADDYGRFGSDTPEQQRAHDAVHDEYEDGCEYWVELFLFHMCSQCIF